MPTAWDFVTRQRLYWSDLNWFDLIDMLALGAEGVIQILRLPSAEDVHFSVFGEELVLLQGRHHHPTDAKWVWFIRSHELADALHERSVELFSASRRIGPEGFNEVLDWLHDYEPFEAVEAIAAGESGEFRNSLARDTRVEHAADAASVLGRLVAMGLVHPGATSLTTLGRQWAQELSKV